MDTHVHVAVNSEVQGLGAVSATGAHLDREMFLPQAPLHEGRGKSIDRSSRVYLFSCAEGQLVGRFLNGNGISPDHGAFIVTEQECHVFFQFLEDGLHPLHGQVQLPDNEIRSHGPSMGRHLPDDEVVDPAMVPGHESQLFPDLFPALFRAFLKKSKPGSEACA